MQKLFEVLFNFNFSAIYSLIAHFGVFCVLGGFVFSVGLCNGSCLGFFKSSAK